MRARGKLMAAACATMSAFALQACGGGGSGSDGSASSDPGASSGTPPASSTPPASGATSLCPNGVSWSDGCANAPKDGVVQFPNFFTASSNGYVQDGIARQSGQTYATRPPYNVAGVDFPVGYSQSAFAGGKDPATAPLPSGCFYYPTGSTSGGPIVQCNHVYSVDIEGYDFSLHNCVPLEIQNGVTGGDIVIKNNNFKNGPNCVAQTYLASVDNGNTSNITLTQNKFDGDALNFDTPMNAVSLNTTGSVTISYNAFLRVSGRPVGTNTSAALDAEDNYVEGFIYGIQNTLHGEFIVDAAADLTATQPLQKYWDNTILQPANVRAANPPGGPAGGGTNGPIWPDSTNPGQAITQVVAQYNTTVVNLAGGAGGLAVSGAASIAIDWSTYVNVKISQNYMDGIGADECFTGSGDNLTPNSAWLTGNVNMRTGTAVSLWNTGC